MVDNIEVSSASGNNKTVKSLSPYTKSIIGVTNYLNPNAKIIFTQLKKMFTKIPILFHFNSEYPIRIETDGFDYAIGGVLS